VYFINNALLFFYITDLRSALCNHVSFRKTPSPPACYAIIKGYKQNPGFMETYWCEKKNSIMDLMNGKDIPIALTPCLKAGCEQWKGGECIQIRKAGKPEKPQVWSKQ
jgi:hypothetical protein